jgi:hypothetical protein
MNAVHYQCEQCGHRAALCVSDWGYIAALCDDCLKARTNYVKLPGSDGGTADLPKQTAGANRVDRPAAR